jgi:hypothetical protein
MLQVTYSPSEQRLLDVAQACRETKFPEKFDMSRYTHFCGTPGCAIGNYAAREDLQDLLYLTNGTLHFRSPTLMSGGVILGWFGISSTEWHELFGHMGCNHAKTASAAADFIEQFVSKKVTARLSV